MDGPRSRPLLLRLHRPVMEAPEDFDEHREQFEQDAITLAGASIERRGVG